MKKLLIVCVAFAISCANSKQPPIPTEQLDFPPEFDKYTISHDRANPTMLMAVYDTTTKKYIFEFIDN
jgi:hypothetical protein